MINGQDLIGIGWKPGPIFQAALESANKASLQGLGRDEVLKTCALVIERPQRHVDCAIWGGLANAALEFRRQLAAEREITFHLFDKPVPYEVFGREGIEQSAIDQMNTACRLPIAARGAVMPDAHPGYGLSIGGVLAAVNSVIPYGVGVDIACRASLSVTDATPREFFAKEHRRRRLREALTRGTRFGLGAHYDVGEQPDHPVMVDEAWDALPRHIQNLKDLAWSQLGTSGSGNHFANFCEIEFLRDCGEFKKGDVRVALLAHSGSRKLGGLIAEHFTDVAKHLCRLPEEARHLAWLDLAGEAGQQYWSAMELAGRYSEASHEIIHTRVLQTAGLRQASYFSHHHNFAWIEQHDGQALVVHRKGATPAFAGQHGLVLGSMGDPSFLVEGKGHEPGLCSASHGAGRKHGRKEAKRRFTKGDQAEYLARMGVELLGGGVDETPQAYKRVEKVLAAQEDLVTPVAKITPRIVLMSDDTRSED